VKISIIVPAFNEERLLGQSLAHITAAAASFTRRHWEMELIVCDNNSTDRTAEIARLDWSEVNLKTGFIEVTAENAKSSQRLDARCSTRRAGDKMNQLRAGLLQLLLQRLIAQDLAPSVPGNFSVHRSPPFARSAYAARWPGHV
jgi:cellulose synthase/poly-beta-1,6-N-acetylglucosamine synthase-like glycosyltransferase